MSEHIVPTRVYYTIFVLLMICTALTVSIAYFDLGPLNTIMALAIAMFKAVLVVLFFMHVKYATRLTWAVIAALTLGLTEVDVPPGAAVAEKLAALFPGITDGALALGSRVWEWAARRSHPTERRGNVANGEAKSDD